MSCTIIGTFSGPPCISVTKSIMQCCGILLSCIALRNSIYSRSCVLLHCNCPFFCIFLQEFMIMLIVYQINPDGNNILFSIIVDFLSFIPTLHCVRFEHVLRILGFPATLSAFFPSIEQFNHLQFFRSLYFFNGNPTSYAY
jgi:hypothetical protein